jgi:hypothetical protein
MITHQVPIGEFEGPQPFFDADGQLID